MLPNTLDMVSDSSVYGSLSQSKARHTSDFYYRWYWLLILICDDALSISHHKTWHRCDAMKSAN